MLLCAVFINSELLPVGDSKLRGCCSAVPDIQVLKNLAETDCWHVSEGSCDPHLHLRLKCVQACLKCFEGQLRGQLLCLQTCFILHKGALFATS